MIFVFFGSDRIFLAICDDVLLVGDFSWELDVFLVVADCSDVFCNNSCPLGETAAMILRDLSTERFCLLDEPYGIVELFTTVPDESTLVCASLASFSFCFCKAFLTSTGEEISAGDLLSLLHDCSCSFFVKRSFPLFALDKGSDLVAIWLLSGDLCRSLVTEVYLDGTFTVGSLSIFVEDSCMVLDVGDDKEQM